jgi:hypothetical protein
LTGRLEIFGVDSGANPALWHLAQTPENTWATAWQSLGAPAGNKIHPQVQVARTPAGSLTVFAIGATGEQTTGNLWSIAQASPAGAWTGWSPLPSAPSVTMKPGFAAGQNADGRFEVIAAGGDGNIYRIATAANGAWNARWTSISGSNGKNLLGAKLAVGNTSDGRLQVFGTAADGRVYTNWQQTAGGEFQGAWLSLGSRGALALFAQTVKSEGAK